MESAQLLDILGNENRRKILQLLAAHPCYMSEIAERLDVGAKAVIGHLLLLERTGLIDSTVDEQRRKYFHIADNLRLEVFVSPYSFEIATTVMEVAAPEHHDKTPALADLKSLYTGVQELMEQRQKILAEYQSVQAGIAEALRQGMDAIEEVAEDDVEAEILYSLIKSPMSKRALSMALEIPEYVLEEYLARMVRKEMVRLDGNNYSIV